MMGGLRNILTKTSYLLSVICVASCIRKAPCSDGRYGTTCELDCPSCCRPFNGYVMCDRDTGHCLEGCNAGCYGDSCQNVCNSKCLNNVCNQDDGLCTQGCVKGYCGRFCENNCLPANTDTSPAMSTTSASVSSGNSCVGTHCTTATGRFVTESIPPVQDDDASGRYLSTFMVITTASLSLLAGIAFVGLIYFICARRYTSITNRRFVAEDALQDIMEHNHAPSTVEDGLEMRCFSASGYWEIRGDEMDNEEPRPLPCFPTMMFNIGEQEISNEHSSVNLSSHSDERADQRYECLDIPQPASNDNLDSSSMEETTNMRTYYLCPREHST